MTYKVHLDGYNQLPFFKGEVNESPRHEFLYWPSTNPDHIGRNWASSQ
jgi:hypothetical protein